ncbi:MAG: hypothetical protein J6A83_08815 [Clostridia bacterium]|nr:hypothetical protein [Clostridia bacterium]
MKYNYFETLESLSLCAYNAVRTACSEQAAISGSTPSDIRKDFGTKLLELEGYLFKEFIPPLKREGIAKYAHSLSRLTDSACEHISLTLACGGFRKRGEEERICIELAKMIHENTALLRSLKKPDNIPDIKVFRELSHKGFEAHNASVSRSECGVSAKSSQLLLSASKLRSELSLCFDVLLETIFNNI